MMKAKRKSWGTTNALTHFTKASALVVVIASFDSHQGAICAADWPMVRHDSALSGVVEASGNIRNPTIAWRFDTRGKQALLEILPRRGERTAKYRFRDLKSPNYLANHSDVWGLSPMSFRLSPDGSITKKGLPTNEQAAKFLPDVPGLQRFVMEDEFTTHDRQGFGRLYRYDRGQEELVWETEPIDTHYSPLVIQADADQDGETDIVMATHYRIFVFDARTGKTKMMVRYHNYRNYGFFGSVNIDEDPYPEFVNIADFSSHVDVIDNDGKELSVQWRDDVEPEIQKKRRILRPSLQSIRDVNRDGRAELVFNYYNEHGDNRWHTVAWDAQTKKVLFDWEGTYLSGVHDLDGDGVDELFISKTQGLYVPKFTSVSVVQFFDGERKTLWSDESGRFPTIVQKQWPPTVASGAAGGPQTVPTFDWNGDGVMDFVTLRKTRYGTVLVEGLVMESAGFDQAFYVELPIGFDCEILAVRSKSEGEDPGVLVSLNIPSSRPNERVSFLMEEADLKLASLGLVDGQNWDWTHLSTEPLVGRFDGREAPTIMVPGGPSEILALQPPMETGEDPRIEFILKGSPLALFLDTQGDGGHEIVFLSEGESGEGMVGCVDGLGRTLWETALFGFPGPPTQWNSSGMTSLWGGRYSVRSGQDVWVSARRSTMHSDEGFVLSGLDGSLLWRRDGVGGEWGCGGSWVASASVDGTRGEEIISLYPVCLWVLSGQDGSEIFYQSLAQDYFPSVWAAYGAPVVRDWLKNGGRPEIYHALGYAAGLSSLPPERIWSATLPTALPGFADLNGDGLEEAIAFELPSPNGGSAPNRFLARNIRSGSECVSLNWELRSGAIPHIVTVDINGDGVRDFLFTAADVLGVLTHLNGKLEKLWEMRLPEPMSPPSVADVDMDGKVEILLYGRNGTLYCIDDMENGL